MLSHLNNPFQEVIPGLYIGSQLALSNPYPLIAEKITHLLGINNYKEKHIGFVMKVMNIDDHVDTEIISKFDECISFIKSAKRILVFCAAGRSRSATVVAAYLIKEKQMSLSEALMTINKARPVRPNDGFFKQLEVWESTHGCKICRALASCRKIISDEEFEIVNCNACGYPMAILKEHMSRGDSCTNCFVKNCMEEVCQKFVDGSFTIKVNKSGHMYWHLDNDDIRCNFR